MSKMIPLSARISEDDLEFLSQLDIEGCTTPSEKIRALISESRTKHLGAIDYKSRLKANQEEMGKLGITIREVENQLNVHSAILTYVINWLPEIMAYILTSSGTLEENLNEAELIKLENAVLSRVFGLAHSMVQLGFGPNILCYDTVAFKNKLSDLAEVIELLGRFNVNQKPQPN
jgi:hypothetical protein